MKKFCVYCGEGYDDEKSLKAHRKICVNNPKSIENIKKQRDEKLKVYTDLQRTVTTFDGIFDMIRDFLLEKGFTIRFDKTPTTFMPNVNESIYGSYPLIRGDDEYAGWKGDWKGEITPINGFDFKGEKQRCTFWDLNGEMSGRFGFKFLRTSGGNWGERFSGGGFILISDFPQLLKMYRGKIKVDQTNETLNDEVDKINRAFLKAENDLTNSDEFLNECRVAMKKLDDYRSSIASARMKHEARIRKNFIANTKIELPEIVNPFIDLSNYVRLRDKFKPDQPDVLNTEDIQNAKDNIIKALDTFDTFVDKNTEYFI